MAVVVAGAEVSVDAAAVVIVIVIGIGIEGGIDDRAHAAEVAVDQGVVGDQGVEAATVAAEVGAEAETEKMRSVR